MTDTQKPTCLPWFPTPAWKSHVRQYIHLLSTARTWFPSHRTASWFVDVLHLSTLNRFPMETTDLLEFCGQHPSPECRGMILEWMLNRSDHPAPGPAPGNDGHSLSTPEHYALLLKWVAGETDNDVLTLLAQIPPPAGMTADERKTALAVWKTRLEPENAPLFTSTKTAIYSHLYLLARDHEEKYRILQETLPSQVFVPLWSHMADRDDFRPPADVPALRQYFLNLLEDDVNPYQRRYGWAGIARLGAGEDESRLLDMARKYYTRQPPPDDEMEWMAFSSWKPDSPSVRAELRAWWYSIDVDVFHPALQARWNALFSLEEDESRLVSLLAGAAPDLLPSVIPDGWCPRCPLAQTRLAGVVTQLLETADSARKTPPELWKLLFRLPVPGPRMAELIHTTLNSTLTEEDDAGSFLTLSLSHIRHALQESPLPTDTPPENIRRTVAMVLPELESRSASPYLSWHSDVLPPLILELLRAGISRPDLSSPTGKGMTPPVRCPVVPETDMAWVTSTMEALVGYLPTRTPVQFEIMTDYVTRAWRDRTLPGTMPIICHLWSLGIKNLEAHVLATGVESHASPYVKSMLSALARLTRQIYPLSPDGNASGLSQADRRQAGEPDAGSPDAGSTVQPPSSVSPPISSGLWKILSDLVRQTTDREIFLLAASIGNALAPDVDSEQQSRWWAALSSSSPALSTNSPDLPDILRRDFLFNHLSFISGQTRGDGTGRHVLDTTAALRQLRHSMHLFPDPGSASPGFWAPLWQETFEAWKAGHSENLSGNVPDRAVGLNSIRLPELMNELMGEPFSRGLSPPPVAPRSPRTAGSHGMPPGDNHLRA